MRLKKRVVKRRTKLKSAKARPGCCEEILFAGFGGQGIMLMGKLLAQAALFEGKHVTWMPSYGAEVRGGTAHSMTKVSDDYIASPVIITPSICVVMNYPSLLKYEDRVPGGGLLVVNKSLMNRMPRRRDIRIINVAMTDIASKLGNIKVANMVGLGALIGAKKVVSKTSLMDALTEMMKGKAGLMVLNKKALEKGYKLGRRR